MGGTKKILVFGDIHTFHGAVEKIVAREKPDLTVFLGDYFDQFRDTPEQNVATARWLKKSLGEKGRIHLFGNHDVHYAYPGLHTACSGFTPGKLEAIGSVLQESDWQRLAFHYFSGGFLFTHAGLHPYFLDGLPVKALPKFLAQVEREARKALQARKRHWSFTAGVSRFGTQRHGGLTWCDFDEFEPIPDLNQIFGHTPSWEPRTRQTADSYNLCLDTTMPHWPSIRHYALVRNGKVETQAVNSRTKSSPVKGAARER